MHRTVVITTPPTATEALLKSLATLPDVTGLVVQRGASLEPPGDVITARVLRTGVGDVIRAGSSAGGAVVVTGEPTAVLAPVTGGADDSGGASWEEADASLSQQGRLSTNTVALVVLGGGIAVAGLTADPATQAVAFVASNIIAPAFEPIARVVLRVAAGDWREAGRAAVATITGYAVLVLSTAAVYAALEACGAVSAEGLRDNGGVARLANPGMTDLLVAGCAALAGMVMVLTGRRILLVGPLIALMVIPAGALVGASVAAGDFGLAAAGGRRLAIEVGFIIAGGCAVSAVRRLAGRGGRPAGG